MAEARVSSWRRCLVLDIQSGRVHSFRESLKELLYRGGLLRVTSGSTSWRTDSGLSMWEDAKGKTHHFMCPNLGPDVCQCPWVSIRLIYTWSLGHWGSPLSGYPFWNSSTEGVFLLLRAAWDVFQIAFKNYSVAYTFLSFTARADGVASTLLSSLCSILDAVGCWTTLGPSLHAVESEEGCTLHATSFIYLGSIDCLTQLQLGGASVLFLGGFKGLGCHGDPS
jgi:hypothetical protein